MSAATAKRADPVEAARAEHAEALRTFHRLRDEERALERDGQFRGATLVTRDDPRWITFGEQLAREKVEAAEQLVAAEDRLRARLIVAANRELAGLTAEYQESAAAVQEARRAFEQAWLTLLLAGFRLGEAAASEKRQANRLARAASPALPGDEAREGMQHQLAYVVPTRVSIDGVEEHEDRPELALFDGPTDALSDDCFTGLAQLVRGGRERAKLNLGEHVLAELEKVENTRTRAQR